MMAEPALAMRAPSSSSVIVEPGRNCWRADRAHRFYAIQDAADYFRLVHGALLRARHTVFILGWDIAAGIDLLPDQPRTDVPTRLIDVLAHAVRRQPALRCYILVWDYGSLYTLERDPFTRLRFGWRTPRRVRFAFDDHHPVGASHHQKVVVIDDELAFSGGIDLTGHRWDTCAHRVDEPARVARRNVPYEPYHDVQAMVDGPAAASLGVLARERWRALGVERIPEVRTSTGGLWPDHVDPDLTDVDVALSRTMPASGDHPAVRECETLFLDSIAAARRTIYIESQYFSSTALGAALAERLREPDGPEVIIVAPKVCQGWLEKNTIGTFRDEVFRQMIAADVHKRLRLVYPLASRARDVPTFIHSKVMTVDDVLVRVGSANCSNRSMGVDTECDVAVDAGDDSALRAGLARIRDRLLGEHLGLRGDEVAAELARAGSFRALIDGRAGHDRCLERIDVPAAEEETPAVDALRAAVDPNEPIGFGPAVDSVVPPVEAVNDRSPLRIWILPGAVLAAAAVVALAMSDTIRRSDFQAVQRAVGSMPDGAPAAIAAVALFVLASLVLVPSELLAIAAGVLFGPVRGGLVALAGSLGAAGIGYAAGRAIGTAGLGRWMSRRSLRSGRQLSARGTMGVALLRLAMGGSAGAIHLLCGAFRVPFGGYMAGSAIGLAPVMVALSGLGALLRQTLLHPTVWNGLLTIGAALFLLLLASAVRAFFLIRQFAPAAAGQRARAEFG